MIFRPHTMSAPQSPSEETSNKSQTSAQDVNLSEAIQLICHAGYPDPTLKSDSNPSQVLQYVIDTLCTLSMHDGLTGLSNQRYFKIALQREVHRARRDGTPCILLMLDIDHFKKINDQYGHPEGDRVLERTETGRYAFSLWRRRVRRNPSELSA